LSINDKIAEIFEEFDKGMKEFKEKPTDHCIITSSAGSDTTGPVITGNTSTTNEKETKK
jgi:hypothetical protein